MRVAHNFLLGALLARKVEFLPTGIHGLEGTLVLGGYDIFTYNRLDKFIY